MISCLCVLDSFDFLNENNFVQFTIERTTLILEFGLCECVFVVMLDRLADDWWWH